MNDKVSARLDQSAELFKALGHPMRLAMLEKLHDKPWCVCDLAASLGLNKSIASKHLTRLYEAGVLAVEKRGTQVIYTLTAPCVVELTRCARQVAGSSTPSSLLVPLN